MQHFVIRSASFCPRFLCFSPRARQASVSLPPRWFPDWASCEFIGCNLPLLLSSLNIHKTLWECVSPLFAVFPVQWTCGTLRSLALVNIHSHLFHPVDVIKLPHSSSLWIFTQLHILSSFPSCSFPGIALKISYLTAWDKPFLQETIPATFFAAVIQVCASSYNRCYMAH